MVVAMAVAAALAPNSKVVAWPLTSVHSAETLKHSLISQSVSGVHGTTSHPSAKCALRLNAAAAAVVALAAVVEVVATRTPTTIDDTTPVSFHEFFPARKWPCQASRVI